MGLEIILTVMVVAGFAMTAPKAIADAIATARASKAGQWDLIDKDRQRRATRGERWAQAWHKAREQRHREAGGDGNYRPGAKEYAKDLYHGFWEDALERRQLKRAARPPYMYDPDAPKWHDKLDAAVRSKVNRVRASRGFRALIDPVGEPQRDANQSPKPAAWPKSASQTGPRPVSQSAPQQATRLTAATKPDVGRRHDPTMQILDRMLAEIDALGLDVSREDVYIADDGSGIPPGFIPVCGLCGNINNPIHGVYAAAAEAAAVVRKHLKEKHPTSTEGDTTMTEATGDVYDVETCEQQCEQIAEDLTRIDASIDVIDEAARSLAAAAEKIGAWLTSKNANDTSITGMATVMEMLNPERIKELMDAVAAAKQGVQDTIESIAPYREADQLLAGAHGSITNGL